MVMTLIDFRLKLKLLSVREGVPKTINRGAHRWEPHQIASPYSHGVTKSVHNCAVQHACLANQMCCDSSLFLSVAWQTVEKWTVQ